MCSRYIIGHCDSVINVLNLNSMLYHCIKKMILRGDGLSVSLSIYLIIYLRF
jgi:hypothetical protein